MTNHIIPTYVKIRVNGSNPRCHRTKHTAIHYGINEQLKFQYAIKKQLGESPLSTCAPDGLLQGVTMPDAV
jgi:hypothetical protein